MQAAEESKLKGGTSVDLESAMLKGKREIKINFINEL